MNFANKLRRNKYDIELPYIICADIFEPNLGSINMKDSRKGNTKDL